MVNNTFPVSEAKPLIKIPDEIPQIGFLGGDAGSEINDSIREDYKDFNALKIGKYSDKIVRGSNPFYAVAVQSRLPAGVRVASPGDLERAMKIGVYDFGGTYEDTGLILRSRDDPNSYLAENLMAQVQNRLGKEAKISGPILIPLYELDLVKDGDSPHGLAFKLKEDAELTSAPILAGKNHGKRFSETDESTGLPKSLGDGLRTLYTRDSGLSRLYLDRNLYLYSDDDNLAYSNDDGRVVLVSTAEGGAQEFIAQKLAELQRIRDAQIGEISQRYQRAEEILRGTN